MSAKPILTTQDIADRLGITPGRVRQLATRLGVGTPLNKRMTVFTEAEAAAIDRDRREPGSGRRADIVAQRQEP